MGLPEVFKTLAAWGVFDIVLPFCLIYAIIYGFLNKTAVLGKSANKYNTIVAACAALLFVVSLVRVVSLMKFIMLASMLLVISFLVILLFSFFADFSELSQQHILLGAIGASLIFAFFVSLDFVRISDVDDIILFLFHPAFVAIALLVALAWWIGAGEETPAEKEARKKRETAAAKRRKKREKERKQKRQEKRDKKGRKAREEDESDKKKPVKEDEEQEFEDEQYPRRATKRHREEREGMYPRRAHREERSDEEEYYPRRATRREPSMEDEEEQVYPRRVQSKKKKKRR